MAGFSQVATLLGTSRAMVREIDTMHLGRDRVIAAHHGARADRRPRAGLGARELDRRRSTSRAARRCCSPTSTSTTPGATGVLVRRFPELRVYVSEVGAPHVIDPARLLASAGAPLRRREHGAALGRGGAGRRETASRAGRRGGGRGLPGRAHARPCPPSRLSTSTCEPATPTSATWRECGSRPGDYTLAPTPPPEIDVEAWLESLDADRGTGAERLRLTHFGLAEDVEEQLERVREGLRRGVERAKAGREAFIGRWKPRSIPARTRLRHCAFARPPIPSTRGSGWSAICRNGPRARSPLPRR